MSNLTKHSVWSGVSVRVDTSGTFYAKVDDIEISDERLSTVREKIDRALNPTAKKRKIALPVIVVIGGKIIPTTLTGVSRTNREPEFTPPVKGSRYERSILADTPANRAIAESWIAAIRALEAALEAVQKRAIEIHGYGRVEIERYQIIIDALVKAHKASGES